MKKIFAVLGLMSFFLLSAVIIWASSQSNEQEEPYDEDTYGPEEPIVWNAPQKSVVFNHKEHTLAADLSCDDCHDELFEMEDGAAEEYDDFNHAAMDEGNYCGACHDGSTAFTYDTRCTSCHIGVRGYARLTGEGAGSADQESGH